MSLEMVSPIIPNGRTTISINHSYNTEETWDGGAIEFSIDNSTTWQNAGPYMTQNGYPNAIAGNAGTALAGQGAFTGNSGGYIETKLSLYANDLDEIKLRFVFASDGNTTATGANPGWYIGNISIIDEAAVFTKAKVTGIGNGYEKFVDLYLLINAPSTLYTYNNDWSPSPGDPSSVSSANDKIIIEAGNATILANTNIYSVIVNPGASLTIDAGTTLAVTNSMTLESVSDSYSSLIIDGAISGPIAYKRFVNRNTLGNDLISPPLAGETWLDFLNPANSTNAADLLDNGADIYAFSPFVKSSDWYVNYTSATSATLVSGTGYRAATDNGTTLTFTGSVLTGQVPVNITYQADATTYPEWNLIGNPYPAYMDMALFLNFVGGTPNRSNMALLQADSGIYGYDGDASNGWKVFNNANASTELMTPGQGFFVAANPDFTETNDIIFDPSMRLAGSGDDFIAGRDANTLTFLKLNASTIAKNYTTQFYFNDNASLGLDPGYDAKILGGAPAFAFYSHLVQDNSGIAMALQSLNPLDLSNVVVPLGVNASQGEQITFTISDSTLPSEVQVYLDDTIANTSTLLNSGDYTLTPNVTLNGTGRFYLRVSNSTLSTPQNSLDDISIYSNAADKTIVIAGQLLETTTTHIYDLQGRVISTSLLDTTNRSQAIDVSSLSTGVYIVQLFNGKQKKTQKLIIK
jgi:hypothetical protein